MDKLDIDVGNIPAEYREKVRRIVLSHQKQDRKLHYALKYMNVLHINISKFKLMKIGSLSYVDFYEHYMEIFPEEYKEKFGSMDIPHIKKTEKTMRMLQ